jgi:transglutaminase-like putative cysteine protease
MTDQAYLQPGGFIDSDAEVITSFAKTKVGLIQGQREQAIALYRAVRDEIAYDPYLDYEDLGVFRASDVLKAGRGFCIGKAAVLAASARAVGIPARLGFADVRNHMTSRRLHELTQTDTFFWHAYVELKIEGKWVKCTPAFDSALCARAKLAPLEFDGVTDSLLQPFDPTGRKHMEYVSDRGIFADVPAATILATMREHYPRLLESGKIGGDFKSEVRAG